MANIEDLKEQLEALKIINEAAYKETVKAIIEQRKLEAQLKAGAIATEDYKKKTEELNNGLKAEAKEMKLLQEEIHKTTEAKQKLKERTDGLRESLEAVTGAADTFTGLNLSMFTSFKEAGKGAIDYSRQIQGINVELRRNTGFANRHVKSFDSIRQSYASVGLDAAAASQAITSLSTGFSAFDGVTTGTRKSLLATAKEFKILGVEFDDFASMNERLRFSFGLVGGAAQAASEDMKRIALETGRPLGTVVKDLNEIGPELARFGSDGPRIFEALAKKARVLGTTIKEAFDITELFDTFEGAANVAGRLNAQLGLQLNSVEMMKATSEERLDILRQEFSMRGFDIQTAGRRQQQMIASILGTDVETAKKMLGPEMDASRFRAEKATQDQMVKLEEKAVAVQQQLIEETMRLTQALTGAGGLKDMIGAQVKALNVIDDNKASTVGGIGGTSFLLGAAGLAGAGLLLRRTGMGGLMSRMRGTAPKTTPAATETTKKLNRKQRRALAAKEKREAKKRARQTPKASPKTSPVSAATSGATRRGLATAGKALGRAIPFLGLGIGIMGAMQKYGEGDYLGAAGEVGVGLMSFVPGLGGLAAAGLGSLALGRRDASRASRLSAQNASVNQGMAQNRARELVIKELVVHSTVELDGTQLGKTIKTYLGKNAKIIGDALDDQLQPTR